MTPLHLAAATGHLDVVNKLLGSVVRRPLRPRRLRRTPADVAKACGTTVWCSRRSRGHRRASPLPRECRSRRSPPSSPRLHPPRARRGDRRRRHVSRRSAVHLRPARVRRASGSLLGPAGIRASPYVGRLLWRGAPSAQLSDLLRVHEYEYLRKIEATCDALKRAEAADPLTTKTDMLDSDTIVTAHSYAAARAAPAPPSSGGAIALRRTARGPQCVLRHPPARPPRGGRGAVGGQSAGFACCRRRRSRRRTRWRPPSRGEEGGDRRLRHSPRQRHRGVRSQPRIPSARRAAFQTAAGTLTMSGAACKPPARASTMLRTSSSRRSAALARVAPPP